MLVFYCSATNPHKQWLKQHNIWSCRVLPGASGHGMTVSSAQVPSGWNPQGCSVTQGSSFTETWVFFQAHFWLTEFSFLAAVGLNFLAGFCWDLLEIWQARLKTCSPCHGPFATLFTSSWPQGRSLLFLLSLTSISSLKVLAWLGQTHPDNLSSDWLQVNWLGTSVTSQNPSPFARWCN